MSTTLKNIKIPYPTEGVIRSAQLDDTVCPENSVQIAVNMNFDEVGAIQTRPGVTEYADDLTGKIQNFGTLNNSIVGAGAERLYNFGGVSIFDADIASSIAQVKLDATHILFSWRGTGGLGYSQIMSADLDTGQITPVGTALTFDATLASGISMIQVDSNHFLILWQGPGSNGFAQILEVNLSTYAVTKIGSPLTVNATFATEYGVAQIDSSHFITFYADGTTGTAEVLAVNLGTWAVTKPGSPLVFDAAFERWNTTAAIGDGLHFINFWSGGGAGDGYAQVFLVNTGTWAITAVGTALEFDTNNASYNNCAPLGDGEHFINFWQGSGGDGTCQMFNVNPSTFAVTALSTPLVFDTGNILYPSTVASGDGEHFITFWSRSGATYNGYAQNFEVNLSTYAITKKGSEKTFGETSTSAYNAAILLDSEHILNAYSLNDGTGAATMFLIQGPITYQDFLYAQEGDGTVLNWDGVNWVSRRSGIQNNHKARFSQFLNYLWMVNGNETIGDAVATSNGGAFGTDLVPTDFPPGDSIQAGFEGRVWVMDAYADAVYYTDIVQFTPPITYTLTFNPEVNYLKNFSSQDGELMTALWEVPRALLLFKQNHIYRIYGANSVDAYPAYNVGTFSEESIIQAKDGIYFHHSSGFYKFDYNSQPVEISRRVIDFVKAIPRASYENIVGVWDGFDNVKWTIGAVTVEGVTYSNCQMRYTISTQVWTIYDYENNNITAMIRYDDGTTINQIMGTDAGVIGALDTGVTDFGEDIYFEMIDRWRSYTSMYSHIKSVSGIMVSSDNGAGTLLQYQINKDTSNEYKDIDTISEDYSSLFPNANTEDFNVMRFRLSGNTNGTPIIFHGIELLSIQDKGLNEN